MDTLKNNFVLHVVDEHNNLTQIEKYLLCNTAHKNYLDIDIHTKQELLEHIATAKKHNIYYRLSNFPSKGGGSIYTFTYLFPYWKTSNNAIQNFYFRNKNEDPYSVPSGFICKGSTYVTNIEDLALSDMVYIDNNITKLENIDTNNGTLEIKCTDLIPRPSLRDYIPTDPYQKCIDTIAYDLYYNLLNNRETQFYTQYYTCESKSIDPSRLIEIVRSMTNNAYTLSLRQESCFDNEFYGYCEPYGTTFVLEKTDVA